MAAVHIAARQGHVVYLSKIITLTYTNVNQKDIWGQTALDQAVMGGHWACVLLLLAQGGRFQAQCL
jgi:ankyrin repeat protein